jgi:two-component system, LytTR family, response regulator
MVLSNIKKETFLLPTANGNEIIYFNSIIRIEAVSNYSRIYFFNGKKMVVSKLLSWFEQRLCSEIFTRVHRSHIINKGAIILYEDNKLMLKNSDVVNVARRKKTNFKAQWEMRKSA